MSGKPAVSEKDKPFILAIIGTLITVLFVILDVVLSLYGIMEAREILKQAVTAFLGLDSMAWTFYLIKKTSSST